MWRAYNAYMHSVKIVMKSCLFVWNEPLHNERVFSSFVVTAAPRRERERARFISIVASRKRIYEYAFVLSQPNYASYWNLVRDAHGRDVGVGGRRPDTICETVGRFARATFCQFILFIYYININKKENKYFFLWFCASGFSVSENVVAEPRRHKAGYSRCGWQNERSGANF